MTEVSLCLHHKPLCFNSGVVKIGLHQKAVSQRPPEALWVSALVFVLMMVLVLVQGSAQTLCFYYKVVKVSSTGADPLSGPI